MGWKKIIKVISEERKGRIEGGQSRKEKGEISGSCEVRAKERINCF